MKHGSNGYANGCRCDVCTEGHRKRAAGEYHRRLADRVLVGGRLVAVTAPFHGVYTTYNNHSCRCVPCTVAAREHRRAYRAAS